MRILLYDRESADGVLKMVGYLKKHGMEITARCEVIPGRQKDECIYRIEVLTPRETDVDMSGVNE